MGASNSSFRRIAHGQLCSVLTALTGAFATTLARRGVNCPTAQSTAMYSALSVALIVEKCRECRGSKHAVAPSEHRFANMARWLALGLARLRRVSFFSLFFL